MEKEGIVSVWAVVNFTEDEIEEYVEYNYDNEEDSRFCIENGVNDEDIDEDFVEKAVCDNILTDVNELLDGFSYSDSFISAFAGKKLPENCNGAILVYNYEYDGNKAENPNVVFLGSAEYSE